MVSAGTTARRRLRRTVVCLDDDPQVLSSLRRLLREEPVDLLTTDKPETVLDWVDHRRVDLLITDLRMPGMDGSEILKVVEERSPSTKSLVLTGFPEASPPSQPMITKPWNDAELKQRIRELTRPLPYVVLMPPEPAVRLALVGVDLDLDELAPGWFETGGSGAPELALIDAQRAGVDAARGLPGAYKVLLTDDAAGARLREWYDAGVDQILRKPVRDGEVADVLRRCVPLARLRQRQFAEPAGAPWPRRLLQQIWKLGAAIPGRTTISMLTAALILGMLFAISVNTMSAFLAAESRMDPFTERFLRFSAQEMMLRRWTSMQQVELGREMNEHTRRYYEEQLQNQRWDGLRPRREAPAPPPARTVIIPVETPSPAPQRSVPAYGTGEYPGNGLPRRP